VKPYVFEAFYQDETIACGCVLAPDLSEALRMVEKDIAASFSVQHGQILVNIGEPKFMQGLTSRIVDSGEDMPGTDCPTGGAAGADRGTVGAGCLS